METDLTVSRSVLIVGCGQLGNRLPDYLDESQWQLSGIRRRPSEVASGIKAIAADYTNANSLQSVLAEQRPDYIVLSLTPASRDAAGYERGYLRGVKNVLASLQHRPRRIVFVSSTSVYAQNNDEWVNEESPALATSYSGSTMLACERLLSESDNLHTSLRCGGIYGGGSKRMIEQIQRGEFSASQHYTNRIHADDCSAVIAHLLEMDRRDQTLADVYLGVDCAPCKKSELESWLAGRLGVSYMTPSSTESHSSRNPGSKRCSNTRLLDTGFEFQYPDFTQGYSALLNS
ncbi:MAG: NAD-dependent epimerase/dehydratase family protein [Pseudomonadales bacterium]